MNSTEDLSFIESVKGNPIIVYAGLQYRRKKENKSTTNWECVKEKCKARLTTNKERTEVIQVSAHICKPDPSQIDVRKAVQQAKKRAREEITTPIPQIYQEELCHVKDRSLGSVTSVPLFSQVKSSLYRHRDQAAEPKKKRNEMTDLSKTFAKNCSVAKNESRDDRKAANGIIHQLLTTKNPPKDVKELEQFYNKNGY